MTSKVNSLTSSQEPAPLPKRRRLSESSQVAESACDTAKDEHGSIMECSSEPTDGRRPGVVYLSRIPHGFYEEQMRSYFSQFGTIDRLRLCRNKSTGSSKHYAFIQFSSSEVAGIVAETMNNYLLYGHLLKCRVVPEAECHEKMWTGANRRWKVPPLAKMRRIKHERKRTSSSWDKLQNKETTRRLNNNKKWKEKGIDYAFDPFKTPPGTENVS
ncbi:hypothetical protein TWF696_009909 [Orbilia brochopaga]|uniref:RRM domain-containing protein n=1 Tax=Orbilia brochopaga TaxID=3140254 RepID=A0AAV9UH17_9PEZI